MLQHSATRCSYNAILWVSVVSFAAITLCVASERVSVVYFVRTQSGNVWIHPRIILNWSVVITKVHYCILPELFKFNPLPL
jgi:hypothetical protein